MDNLNEYDNYIEILCVIDERSKNTISYNIENDVVSQYEIPAKNVSEMSNEEFEKWYTVKPW